jgi:hypothetical protein
MQTRAALVVMAMAFAVADPLVVWADCITLKSGGELRGEISADAKALEKAPEMTIRTLSGATVIVARDEVAAVVRRRLLVEEYETRRRAADHTVTGQWDLAEWCRRHSLPNERAVHLQRVVDLDAEHVAAHRALGHVRLEKGWGTPAEVKSARGFVKHKGKYLGTSDVTATLAEERATEAQRELSKKVKQWHTWLTGAHSDLRARAESELAALRDPDAVPALARALRSDSGDERRLFFVKVLSQIDGDRPVPALAAQSLQDESEIVRAAALRCVQQKNGQQAIAVYVRALKNPENVVVNRAGAALGELGQESALSPMIDALVTRHEYTVEVPNPEPFICTEGQNNTGNVVLPPSVALRLLSSGIMPLVAQNMPKPVPGQEPEKEMMTVTFQRDEENPEVLAALARITEENYGFDKQTWRKWYNTHKRKAASTAQPKRVKSRVP